MKILNYFYSSIAVLVLLMTSVSQSSALERIDIRNITDNSHYVTVYFDALTNDPYDLDAIRIYEAEGYTVQKSDFSLIREYDISDYPNGLDSITWNSQINSLFTIKSDNFPNDKKMSYYMSAVSGQNESAFSDSVYFYYSQGPIDSIMFTTSPPTVETILVGDELTYDADAYSVLQNEIRYKLVNPTNGNATIDEMTGELTFKATEKGNYIFTIRAYLEKDENKYVDQTFRVNVFKCHSLITCNITVNNEVPSEISKSTVDIYMKTKDTLMYFTTASISPNGFFVENVDEGEYVMQFRGKLGNQNVSSWYLGKTDMNSADAIQTACEDTLNLDWNIEYVNTTNYLVSIDRISELPSDFVKKGSVYEKQITYTTYPANEEVVFSLSDKTNFSLTGPNKDILALNTSEPGVYEVVVVGALKDFPKIKSSSYVKVWVTECDGLQTLTVNVKDILTGNNISKYVYADIYSSKLIGKDTLITNHIDSTSSSNGVLQFEVDKGSYYLQLYTNVSKNNNYKEYRYIYNSEKPAGQYANLTDGEAIEVLCENQSINWEIRVPKDITKSSISGTVTDEDTGEPIKWAYVNLVGKDILTDEIFLATTGTDSKGNYFITATNEAEYAISAVSSDSLTEDRYAREYWKETPNAAEATKFKLINDKQSVDFTLEKLNAEFKNSLNGAILDENGNPITWTPVIAYLIETNPFNTSSLYTGVSTYTNGDGEFRIENLVPGQYIVYAYIRGNKYKPGYYSGAGNKLVQSWFLAKKIEVKESGNFGDFEVKLEELKAGKTKQIVKGKVEKLVSVAPGSTNASAPINGVQVIVTDPAGEVINFNYSDEKGEFEVPNIGTGSMNVYFDKVGYKVGYDQIKIENGQTEANIFAIMEPLSTTSVDDFESINATVFPNPTNNNVTISGDFEVGEYIVKVVDMSGNTVMINHITLNSNSDTELELSNLNSGQYMINLFGNDNNYSTKITVIK